MTSIAEAAPRQIGAAELTPGTILVSSSGVVKILRSRTKVGTGWNCSDGAGISDIDAGDSSVWSAYTPADLVADLGLAKELHGMAGERELSGGLATWDACSGRRCVLPRLAKIVR